MLLTCITILLAIIAWQDFKTRGVYWHLFLALVLLFSTQRSSDLTLAFIGQQALYNLGFLAIQLLAITTYFSIRHKKITNIFDRYLGWGDVVFLVALSIFLAPVTFIAFYIISAIFALLVGGVIQIKQGNFTIPLAGIQAILLIGLLLIDQCTSIGLQNGVWIIKVA